MHKEWLKKSVENENKNVYRPKTTADLYQASLVLAIVEQLESLQASVDALTKVLAEKPIEVKESKQEPQRGRPKKESLNE